MGKSLVHNYLIHLIGMVTKAILLVQFWYVIFGKPYRDGHEAILWV